jgi:plasmid replication initiation protein
MNKNTIEFNDFILDIPKISKEQYFLLRHILITIEKNINVNKSYFITSSIFKDVPFEELISLLKTNIKLSITDKNKNSWYGSDAINDIEIEDDKIFFRPASILREIVLNSKESSKHAYLKYILFNGIRYKQTLLFIDYMLKKGSNNFTIEVLELKKILELKPTQYKNFNAFNASVIDRIVSDINTKTNYHISYETTKKKNGKKIISLTFDFFNQDLNNA